MRYKVGDKVRVRGDLEVGWYSSYRFSDEMIGYKNSSFTIKDISDGAYVLKEIERKYYFVEDMLRPAEFKIWCETEEEKQAVLEELEKEGYAWGITEKKATEQTKGFRTTIPVGVLIRDNGIFWREEYKNYFAKDTLEFTPSEFTGIDFSEKIIITKTPTGATATYGEKIVTADGEFIDASRQAIAEALCPFKVGDRVFLKANPEIRGEVTEVSSDMEVRFSDEIRDTWYEIDELEPYTEPPYNAKLFCVEGSAQFDAGYVFEIKNGMFISEDIYLSSDKPFAGLADVNNRFSAKFMEIKGGLDD